MIRMKIEGDLEPWIAEASASLLASFAAGIAKSKAAVHAAITQPWSNGQTEGQVNKLKMVKRQMYGRAKVDLLEARLIGAALTCRTSSKVRQTQNCTPKHSKCATASRCATVVTIFSKRILQRGIVQHGIGQAPLQPRVLIA